jgi:acyl-coenzyme A thioesterase PaaI-like protein
LTPQDAEDIRRRAIEALSKNRIPGYHFGGLFLDLECRRYDRGGVVLEMDTGAHNANPDGTTHFSAVAFLADMALASSCRAFVDPSRRTATLTLEVRVTGEQARGRLRAEAHSQGFVERTALPQAYCSGRILAGDKEVMRMSGTWVSPPSPDGKPLHPLPWEAGDDYPVAPHLGLDQLDRMERAVLRRVESALRVATHGDFMQRLFVPVVRHTTNGAVGSLPIGLYVGNRVGHVQGGFTFNTAVATAIAAVPHHPLLTAVSAWYISPGQGKALRARATVLQKGRNVAVVRTEVFATGGKRVLEAVSNHAIAAK